MAEATPQSKDMTNLLVTAFKGVGLFDDSLEGEYAPAGTKGGRVFDINGGVNIHTLADDSRVAQFAIGNPNSSNQKVAINYYPDVNNIPEVDITAPFDPKTQPVEFRFATKNGTLKDSSFSILKIDPLGEKIPIDKDQLSEADRKAYGDLFDKLYAGAAKAGFIQGEITPNVLADPNEKKKCLPGSTTKPTGCIPGM